ncbi:MAG: TIM barrel protein [Pseudomonadota bacterium]
MTKFSANLGFLWADLSLPDAIRAASAAGFDAVECHWPYETPADDVRSALLDTGLPMLGLNTVRGKPGENGLSALPGREVEARAAIDQAIAYADAVDARAIHVMAGFAQGDAARQCFESNLSYATDNTDRVILIEPLNRHDAPGYFLQTTDQARMIVEAVDRPNLKMMFDCYHVGRTEGDVATRLAEAMPFIGHIQFASIPDRGPPTAGELNYKTIFENIAELGWTAPLGAEFKPKEANQNADWLRMFRS